MFEEFINTVMSEYGIFTSFLILTDVVLIYTIKVLWTRNEDLSNKFIDTVENNTRVITQLVDKIDEH